MIIEQEAFSLLLAARPMCCASGYLPYMGLHVKSGKNLIQAKGLDQGNWTTYNKCMENVYV